MALNVQPSTITGEQLRVAGLEFIVDFKPPVVQQGSITGKEPRPLVDRVVLVEPELGGLRLTQIQRVPHNSSFDVLSVLYGPMPPDMRGILAFFRGPLNTRIAFGIHPELMERYGREAQHQNSIRGIGDYTPDGIYRQFETCFGQLPVRYH
ncbi:hypothetical protein J4475_00280 [Candidatus Woesearchaeota archaeon]|nr:hypothetical protein [Candidatus Woesearchaeota archaeon]